MRKHFEQFRALSNLFSSLFKGIPKNAFLPENIFLIMIIIMNYKPVLWCLTSSPRPPPLKYSTIYNLFDKYRIRYTPEGWNFPILFDVNWSTQYAIFMQFIIYLINIVSETPSPCRWLREAWNTVSEVFNLITMYC